MEIARVFASHYDGHWPAYKINNQNVHDFERCMIFVTKDQFPVLHNDISTDLFAPIYNIRAYARKDFKMIDENPSLPLRTKNSPIFQKSSNQYSGNLWEAYKDEFNKAVKERNYKLQWFDVRNYDQDDFRYHAGVAHNKWIFAKEKIEKGELVASHKLRPNILIHGEPNVGKTTHVVHGLLKGIPEWLIFRPNFSSPNQAWENFEPDIHLAIVADEAPAFEKGAYDYGTLKAVIGNGTFAQNKKHREASVIRSFVPAYFMNNEEEILFEGTHSKGLAARFVVIHAQRIPGSKLDQELSRHEALCKGADSVAHNEFLARFQEVFAKNSVSHDTVVKIRSDDLSVCSDSNIDAAFSSPASTSLTSALSEGLSEEFDDEYVECFNRMYPPSQQYTDYTSSQAKTQSQTESRGLKPSTSSIHIEKIGNKSKESNEEAMKKVIDEQSSKIDQLQSQIGGIYSMLMSLKAEKASPNLAICSSVAVNSETQDCIKDNEQAPQNPLTELTTETIKTQSENIEPGNDIALFESLVENFNADDLNPLSPQKKMKLC